MAQARIPSTPATFQIVSGGFARMHTVESPDMLTVAELHAIAAAALDAAEQIEGGAA